MKMTVTGLRVDMIERAIHSGFYGINGDNDAAREARGICNKAVAEVLEAFEIKHNSFEVLDAKMTGNRKAQILFKID